MKMSNFIRIITLILFGTILTSYAADDTQSATDMIAYNLRLGFGLGISNLLDSEKNLVETLFLEGQELDRFWSIRPLVSITLSDEGGFYAALGVLKEWDVGKNWSLGAGFSAGGFEEGIDEEDLGHDIEFYSRVLLEYQVQEIGLLRCEIGHISNGSLGDVNPGSELVILSWVIDL